jgi:DNA-binding NtrC family response regulator
LEGGAMKVIIVENELYLAQSIATKLGEYDFDVEIFSSAKDAMKSDGDIYLLSTSLPGQNFLPLISEYKEKIIILMVNYINNDTVGEPLKQGAKDYIVKPFMIEELLRKIDHYNEFQQLKEQNKFYQEYLENLLSEIDHQCNPEKLSPAILVKTNYLRAVDKLAMDISKTKECALVFISLEENQWQEKVSVLGQNNMGYITHLEKLKKSDREELFGKLEGKRFILTSTSETIETPFDTITVNSGSKLYDQNDVLTIDEYVQYIVKNFQYKFPDTELSKKLGISRKSLWEKRKKYDLFKKK